MRKSSSSGPSKRPASGNTFKKSSGSRSGGYGDKYPKKREEKEGSDKPYKSRDDKPKGSFGEDRPKRSFGEDRPKGKPGDRSDRPFDKPKRSFGDDRPKRDFGDKPKRSFGDDRPKRSFGDDKPKRDFGDKPKRSFGEDRPRGKFDDTDRPKRSFGNNKPKKDYGDKPFKKKFEDSDKPKRSFGEDRPIKKFENRSRAERKLGDDKPKRDFGDKPYKKREEGDKPKGSFGEYRAKGKYGDKDKAKRSFGEDSPKKDFGDKPFKKKFDDGDKPKKKFDKAPEKKKFGDDIFKPEPKKDKIEKIVSELEGFTKSLDEDKPIRGFIANAKKERPDVVARKKYEEGKPKKYRNDELDEEEDEEIEEEKPQSDLMPLNKFIAHSGECSRREAAELVKKGKVKVNGELVTDPGHKVSISDTVSLVGKKLTLQKEHVYVLLNKPKDFITTTDDPEGRKTVMDLIAGLGVERVYPVGRLDRNTTGLLLLTNDGDLAQKLSHPSYSIKKVYQVTLDKALTKADFEKIVQGVELEDGIAHVDEIAYLEKKNEIGLEIHSGKNRIVRRIFESLGYVVEKLDRMMYAGLTKKNLPRSKWRLLTDKEIIVLKHFKG